MIAETGCTCPSLQQGTGPGSSPFEEYCDNLQSNSYYADQSHVHGYMIIILVTPTHVWND